MSYIEKKLYLKELLNYDLPTVSYFTRMKSFSELSEILVGLPVTSNKKIRKVKTFVKCISLRPSVPLIHVNGGYQVKAIKTKKLFPDVPSV